jgi:hypothetical protein
VRGKLPIHPLRARSKTWRAAGCSWPSKYSGWKAKEFPCLKPKNNGIAHAGNCNHSDRRARNRLRSPQVGVSPRPLTTTTATSVLIAHSSTLPRFTRAAHLSRFQSRQANRQLFGLWQDRLRSLQANRRPTLDRLASETAPPKVALGRGFPFKKAFAATEAPKEKPRRNGATQEENYAKSWLS